MVRTKKKVAHQAIAECVTDVLACSKLSVSGDDRKAGGQRAGSGREKERVSPFSLPDPTRRPPAFTIASADREPRTGRYILTSSVIYYLTHGNMESVC